MRDLQDYKAEVFRRSEERITRRRRIRSAVLAWGIPLVLCIAVFSVAMLPEGERSVSGGPGGQVSAYTAVEIRNTDGSVEQYRKVTDKTAVAGILSMVQSFVGGEGEPAYGTSGGAVNENAPEENLYMGTPQNYCRIAFTSADGAQMEYILSGNRLIRTDTNKEQVLTDSQLAELKALLALKEERSQPNE